MIVLLHATLLGAAKSPCLLIGYLGPGSGVSALGSLLALSVAIFVAIFGFVWFPLKRLLRLRKRSTPKDEQVAAVPAHAEPGLRP
ncbi:hypothetical protein ACFL5Q_05185 [Planctomycetota bacterium]